jgi:hypothetical protein
MAAYPTARSDPRRVDGEAAGRFRSFNRVACAQQSTPSALRARMKKPISPLKIQGLPLALSLPIPKAVAERLGRLTASIPKRTIQAKGNEVPHRALPLLRSRTQAGHVREKILMLRLQGAAHAGVQQFRAEKNPHSLGFFPPLRPIRL